MDILQSAIEKNEIFQKKNKKQRHIDPKFMKIVEEFIINKQLVCYGGTAINNILPKETQFYDYNLDIPDYDFFSPNATKDAKELCDIFAKEPNVYHVETKSAFFVGTYKVFVNFIPVADITQVHQDFYNSILKGAIIVDQIPYTNPTFLRMSLHQELSRPLGDVSRWEKIFKRMQILNKHYPIKDQSESVPLNQQYFTNETIEEYSRIIHILKKNDAMFCNMNLVQMIYKKYMKPKIKSKIQSKQITESFISQQPFIVLHNDSANLVKSLRKEFPNTSKHTLKVKKVTSIYKFVKDYYEVFINNNYVGTIFDLDSCMSFYEYKVDTLGIINVGSLDTLLYIYFTLCLIRNDHINIQHIECLISQLYYIIIRYDELAEKYLSTKEKQKKYIELLRFNLPCLGSQDDYELILRNRHNKFKTLKDAKNTDEYKKWFFKYTPKLKGNDTSENNKTRKSKLQNKTKKVYYVTKSRLLAKTSKSKTKSLIKSLSKSKK